MIRAQMTAARPMVKPTDRSIPPEMITKVWPSANRSGATANRVMLWILNGLMMKEVS